MGSCSCPGSTYNIVTCVSQRSHCFRKRTVTISTFRSHLTLVLHLRRLQGNPIYPSLKAGRIPLIPSFIYHIDPASRRRCPSLTECRCPTDGRRTGLPHLGVDDMQLKGPHGSYSTVSQGFGASHSSHSPLTDIGVSDSSYTRAPQSVNFSSCEHDRHSTFWPVAFPQGRASTASTGRAIAAEAGQGIPDEDSARLL